ncbi:hypothetical protein ACHAW6_000669, partial [Cyclotella cf. meneghiniana]
MHLSGSIPIHPSWVHCPTQGKTYHPAKLIWHHLCRSFLMIALCLLHDRPIFCTNVLNLDTGLVSLQFHRRYDDFFETISFNKPETKVSSNWHVFAGLVRPDKTPTVEQVLRRTRPSQPIADDTNLLVPNQNPAQVPDELSFINFDN